MSEALLTADGLVERRWSVARGRERPVAPQMILFRDGRIGACADRRLSSWRVSEGALTISDEDGVPSLHFASFASSNDVWRLSGQDLEDGSACAMQEVTPAQLGADIVAAADPEPTSEQAPREFLVIVRAGPASLHHEWEQDIAADRRNWDLCLSYFGSDAAFARSTSDLFCHQLAPGVLFSLHHLLHARSPLWRYRNIMLCHERIMTRWSDLNRLFARVVEHDLLIAQPAMSDAGFAEHALERVRPDTSLRYTSYVGRAAPVFTSDMLKLAAPTFDSVGTAQGIDHLWSFLAGRPRGRIGIIDDVTVTLTEALPKPPHPVLGEVEEKVLSQLYGFSACYDEHGALRRRASDA